MGRAHPPEVVAAILYLYEKTDLTQVQIGELLGVPGTTLGAILKRNGIKARNGKATGPHKTRRWIRMYVEDDLSATRIAELEGSSPSTVAGVLRRNGIDVRNRGSVPGYDTSSKQIDPITSAEIIRLYTEQKLSKREIARRLPVSQMAVHNVLRRAEIPNHPRYLIRQGTPPLSQQEVRDAVDAIQSGMTVPQAAEHLGITRGQVYHRLKLAGVTPPQRQPVRHKDAVKAHRLHALGYSHRQVGERLGISTARARTLIAAYRTRRK